MQSTKLIRIEASDAGGKIVSDKTLSPEKLRASILSILKGNVLCAIATVGRSNRAHISTAYFCYSHQLELFFLSHPHSVHSRNLSHNSQAAIAVFSPSEKWGGPDRGLQLFGICHEARGVQRRGAERLYSRRFPRYSKWSASLGAGDLGQDFRFYRLVVSSLKVLDEKSLGDGLVWRAAVQRRAR